MAASRMLGYLRLRLRHNRRLLAAVMVLLVLLLLPLIAEAQQPTTTSLTVQPSNASPAQVVTLTATVIADSEPVTVGTVTFLSGKQVLGTVQVEGGSGSLPGTATLKLGFPPGTYQLTAQYNGNNDFRASTSSPQPLTVNGTEPTITM